MWQVAVAYAGAGFVLWQVADVAFPHLGLPDGVLTALIWATLAGFPVAIVLAWMYDTWRSTHGIAEQDAPGAAPAEPEPNGDGRSLVVLPFENLSPDPDDAFFADGLTEELIADLSRVRAIRVISRASAMSLRGTALNAPAIARELSVRYVLGGSVRRSGPHLRITAQLVDGRKDTPLWSEKFAGTLEDVFALQEDLSRKIVDGLSITLEPEEEKALGNRPIEDIRAYELYLRARASLFEFTAPAVERAIRDLRAGLELVGENGALLRGLGMALFQQMNAGLTQDTGVIDEVEECARRIRTLDPEDSASFMLRGLASILQGDVESAVIQFRESYFREQRDPDILVWLGVGSLATGQMEAAGDLIGTLYRVDPLSPLSPLLMGYHAFFDGRFSDAAAFQEEALRLGPEVAVSLWQGVRTFVAAEEQQRAEECLQALNTCAPGSPFAEAAGLLMRPGNTTTARLPSPSEALRVWATRDGEWGQYLSDAYARAGDGNQALEWLRLSMSAGFLNHTYLARHDPFIAPFRGLPEWDASLAEVERARAAFEDRLAPLPPVDTRHRAGI